MDFEILTFEHKYVYESKHTFWYAIRNLSIFLGTRLWIESIEILIWNYFICFKSCHVHVLFLVLQVVHISTFASYIWNLPKNRCIFVRASNLFCSPHEGSIFFGLKRSGWELKKQHLFCIKENILDFGIIISEHVSFLHDHDTMGL